MIIINPINDTTMINNGDVNEYRPNIKNPSSGAGVGDAVGNGVVHTIDNKYLMFVLSLYVHQPIFK